MVGTTSSSMAAGVGADGVEGATKVSSSAPLAPSARCLVQQPSYTERCLWPKRSSTCVFEPGSGCLTWFLVYKAHLASPVALCWHSSIIVVAELLVNQFTHPKPSLHKRMLSTC